MFPDLGSVTPKSGEISSRKSLILSRLPINEGLAFTNASSDSQVPTATYSLSPV